MQLENAKRQLGMFAAMGGLLVEQQRLMAIVEELAKQQLPEQVCSCKITSSVRPIRAVTSQATATATAAWRPEEEKRRAY
jgi:hypothetical protein